MIERLENTDAEIERHTPPESFGDCSFFTIRHADALYQMNEEIVASENPEFGFNPALQNFSSDLSPEGKLNARKKAEIFLSNFDPDKDALFFASSNLVRSRETASIFLTVAKERGFTIVQSEKGFTHKLPEFIQTELGNTDIRTLESLSLNIDNMLVEFIFHPDDYLDSVNVDKIHVFYPDNISSATKALWKEARAVIEKDNKGTWGKNFLAHGDEIKKIFSKYASEHKKDHVPTVTTAQDMYRSRFKTMMKEMRVAKADAKEYEQATGKRVRVLAFSHENSFIHFLNKEFNQQGIDKLEAIGYDLFYDDDGREHYVAAIENENSPQNIKEISMPNSTNNTK